MNAIQPLAAKLMSPGFPANFLTPGLFPPAWVRSLHLRGQRGAALAVQVDFNKLPPRALGTTQQALNQTSEPELPAAPTFSKLARADLEKAKSSRPLPPAPGSSIPQVEQPRTPKR